MTGEDQEAPKTVEEFLARHREAIERHADRDRPASWLTEAVVAAAQQPGRESNEGDTR